MSGSYVTRATRWLKGMMGKHVHGMITCVQFEQFIMAYLDDELPPAQRRVFDWHMKACRECREYLAAYQRASELAGATLGADHDAVPEDVPEDLVHAILDARKR